MTCSLEAAIAAINAEPNLADSLIAAKVRGLMAGYHARWNGAPYEVESVEETVTADLYNPATKARSRTFKIAGKLDITATYEGKRVIVDHKTTSEDITDPNSPYWRQLAIDTQASHYILLEWMNGRLVDYALWDVIRKPSIAPRALTKLEAKGIQFTARYFGRDVSRASVAAAQETGRENLELYEARLAHDCTVERPNWYFGRRLVPRLNAEIVEYATDLWNDGQELITARANDRHSRNPGACLMYGRPCKFLGICSGHDTPDSDKWTRKTWMHNELPVVEGDGRDVLTNSRLKTFRTCHKKHFYEYELGIERVDEEEAEALFFGSLMHKAQEVWWLSSKTSQENDNDERFSYAANGVASASTADETSAANRADF